VGHTKVIHDGLEVRLNAAHDTCKERRLGEISFPDLMVGMLTRKETGSAKACFARLLDWLVKQLGWKCLELWNCSEVSLLKQLF